jgi:hypothetical protein
MTHSHVVTRSRPEKVVSYSIRNNFTQHCNELEQLGATGDDVEPLYQQVLLIEKLEEQVDFEQNNSPELRDETLTDHLAPLTCANGWIIARPTLMAKRWAAMAMMKVTGGAEPDGIGLLYAILAALWALKLCGENKSDQVMQTICGGGALSKMVCDLADQDMHGATLDQISADYAELMFGKKKEIEDLVAARTKFEQMDAELMERLRNKQSGPSTSES